ncbi:MAG: twin-arginine translocation signal domain-containing protein, partial [Pirellulales bacterium]
MRSANRRTFLKRTAAFAAGLAVIPQAAVAVEEKTRHKVERLGIGAIGMRYQGSVIADKARLYGDVVAIADVDRNVREQARAS